MEAVLRLVQTSQTHTVSALQYPNELVLPEPVKLPRLDSTSSLVRVLALHSILLNP